MLATECSYIHVHGCYNASCSNIPNGAEVDISIPEDFPLESLVQFINTFAQVRNIFFGMDNNKHTMS